MSQNHPPLPPRPPLRAAGPPPWEDETVRFAVPVHAGYPGQDGTTGWYAPEDVAPHRRASRGLLIGGIAALAAVLLSGAVWAGLSLRTTADSRAAGPATASFPSAASSAPATETIPAAPVAPTAAAPRGTTPAPVAPAGAQGVLAACRTILPAIMQLETDVDSAGTPAQVVARITALQGTLHAAGTQAHSPAFAAHVQKLADDFGRMAAAVRDGGDPSSFLQVLQGDGTTVGTDCGLAGWRP